MSSFSKEQTSPQFTLDASVPARPVSFPLLQRLAAGLSANQPLRYSDIVERPILPMLTLFSASRPRPPSRATRYHHWNALRILALIEQSDGGYRLTGIGRELASAKEGTTGDALSPAARSILCQAVRDCPLVRRNFLVLFTGNAQLDPWTDGKPLGVETIRGKRAVRLNNPNWRGTVELSVSQTYGILWGLGQWCRSVGLVDEILIRPQADVTDARANILFPVDPDAALSVSVERFDELIKPYFAEGEPAPNDAKALSIPLLLYRLCPAERISLAAAKNLLMLWLRRQANGAWVQAPSAAALNSERVPWGNSQVVWRKQQEAFLTQGDTVFTRLVVSARLGAPQVEPDVPWPQPDRDSND